MHAISRHVKQLIIIVIKKKHYTRKHSGESMGGAEKKNLSDPEVCTKILNKSLRDPEVGIEDTEKKRIDLRSLFIKCKTN